jgi:hypothetical protein
MTDQSGMDDGGGPTAIEMISKPFIGLFWTLLNYIGTLIGESSVPEGPAAPIQPLPTDPPQRIDTGGGSRRFQGGNIWVWGHPREGFHGEWILYKGTPTTTPEVWNVPPGSSPGYGGPPPNPRHSLRFEPGGNHIFGT